jgi:pimeloyl-ACP methyl ester carboxylesterase
MELTAKTFGKKEHQVQSSHAAWLKLYVREALPVDSPPRAVIILVHGTFMPGVIYDCSAPGYSWLEDAASQGIAAYYVDLRGYGQSSRPPPEEANKPFCRHDQAILDIDDVVEFARRRTGAEQVSLFGFSWGSLTVPLYALANPSKVRKIVLAAPLSRGGEMAGTGQPPMTDDPGGMLFSCGFSVLRDAERPNEFNSRIGTFCRWSRTDSARHAAASLPSGVVSDWIDPTVSGAVRRDFAAVSGSDGDISESPTGAQCDLFDYYVRGRRFYDPADLNLPTLVMRGERDFANRAEAVSEYFSQLGAKEKSLVTLGSKTHTFFLEKNAAFARAVVHEFLLRGPD